MHLINAINALHFLSSLDVRRRTSRFCFQAHCERFDDYVDEVINEIHAIKTKNPKYRKVILLGHSMGGLVAFRVSNRVQLSGLVLSAPLLKVYLLQISF